MSAAPDRLSATRSVTALVVFLLARIDEEEAEARSVGRRAGRHQELPPLSDLGHNSRVLAECASKRRIVGHAQHLLVLRDQPHEAVVRDHARQVLAALALPWAAHPGYRSEWS